MVEQQKDLLTNRWRQVSAAPPSEAALQMALVQHLHYRAHKDVVYFHVANGEQRDKRVAAKLKAMGVLPGVADLVFVWGQADGRLRNLYLELKARGRRMALEQQIFCDRVTDAGAAYACADNIDDALAILQAHGIIK